MLCPAPGICTTRPYLSSPAASAATSGVTIEPRSGSAVINSTGQAIDIKIDVVLDQSFDPQELARHISFTDGAGKAVEFRVDRTDLPPGSFSYTEEEGESDEGDEEEGEEPRTYTPPSRPHPYMARIAPVQPLAPATNFTLVIAPAFHGDQGPLTMGKELRLRFRTYDPLKIVNDGTRRRCKHGIEIGFNNPVDPKVLDENLVVEPPVKFEEPGNSWETGMPYSGAMLEPESAYKITVKGSMTDKFGNRLGSDYTFTLNTDPLEPLIDMNQGLLVMEADGPHRLPVNLRNIEGFDLAVTRFEDPAELFVKEAEVGTGQGFLRRMWSSVTGEGKARSRKWSTRVKIEPRPVRRILYGLDLSPYIDGKAPFGIYRLKLSENGLRYCGWDRSENFEREVLVQVTDLGITAKSAPDRALVWVTSLKTGKPEAGARVELFAVDRQKGEGKKVGEGVTDKDGTLALPVPEPMKENPWNRSLVFLARKGADAAYLEESYYGSRFSSSWDFGVPEGARRLSRLKGFLFTERGVYRPGEEVHFKGWLRARVPGGLYNVTGRKLAVTVSDRKGEVIVKSEIPLSQFGGFDGKATLPANVPLGYCAVRARFADEAKKTENKEGESDAEESEDEEEGVVAYCSFSVSEYRVPEFEVLVKGDRTDYVAGDTLSAQVTGRYLFGAPMPDAPLRWSLRMAPSVFTPPGHPGFVFGDWGAIWEGEEGEGHLAVAELLGEGQGALSPEGAFSLTHALGPAKGNADYTVTLETTVTDTSRQEISGRWWGQVHAAEYALGLRPSDTLLQAGKKVAVDLVAVDPQGKPVAGRKAALSLVRRDWHTVRRQDVGGWWTYESKPQDTVVESREVPLGDGTGKQEFTVKESGEYILRADSLDPRGNRAACSAYLWVWGEGYVPWRMTNDTRIDLVADKKEYKPGDVARILVKNPLGPCTALVTLERETFLERWLVPVKESAPVIEVPLRENHMPNAYVSVVLMRGRTSEELDKEGKDAGRPAFGTGLIQLPVSIEPRRLAVAINAPSQEQPGETVSISLFVSDAVLRPVRAEVTLMAVDVGVLNLTGYQMPDPLAFFWGPEGDSVRTEVSLRNLLERMNFKMKGYNPGGGGKGMEGLSRLRGTFLTTPLFLPAVVTDQAGQAKVSFKLPDNLTRFRIMAVAADAKESFGAGFRDLTVNLPLMIQPALPRFANLGDRFTAGAVVRNQTGAEREVAVSLAASGIAVPEPTPRKVRIPDGGSAEVTWAMAADRPGEAALEFAASAEAYADRARYTFPLQTVKSGRGADPYKEVTAAYGVVDKRGAEKVTYPAHAVPDIGGLTVTAGATALSGLEQAVDALVEYPYGCLEQQLSRLVPLVALRDIVREFRLTGRKVNLAKMDEAIVSFTREIPLFQKSSGGMGYWKDAPYTSPYLSAYCLEYLIAARELGEIEAKKVLEGSTGSSLVSYLKKRLEKTREYREKGRRGWFWDDPILSPPEEAYVCWLLARYGDPDVGYQNYLWPRWQGKMEDFGAEGTLWLLGAMAHSKAPQFQVDGLAKAMTRLTAETAEHAYLTAPSRDPWDDFEVLVSPVARTALGLDILSRYRPDFVSIPKMARYLTGSLRNGSWRTTHEGARCLLALATYYRTFESKAPDFSYRVALAGKVVKQGEFRRRTTAVQAATTPLADLKGLKDADLAFEKDGSGLLYYGARLSYYSTFMTAKPLDEGFRVERTVEPLEGGKPGDSFAAGSRLRVTLKVATDKHRSFVVIEDPLPAGCEAVDSSLATASREALTQAKAAGSSGSVGGWWSWFTAEARDDRVVVIADSLPPGTFTYRYVVNATTRGEFLHGPARAEEMYNPETFGRGAAGRFTVR